MRRRELFRHALFLTLLLAAPPVAAADAALAERVATAVERSEIVRRGAEVGVYLAEVDPRTGEVREVAALDADEAMTPASNMKLLTTAAALDALGETFRFRTALAIRETPGGVVEVAVVGDGDPTFGDSEYLRRFGWSPTTVLDAWARSLREAGYTRVDRLLLDDGVFDRALAHPRWSGDDQQRAYGAQVGGLNLNANTLDVYVTRRGDGERVGFRLDPPTGYGRVTARAVGGDRNSVWLQRDPGGNDITIRGQTNARVEQGPLRVTVHDPTAFFGTVAAERLARAGIDVAGPPLRDPGVREQLGDPAAGWRVLRVHETRLPTVLARTNKDSENLYAEALLKRLGHAATGGPGGWDAGARAVAAYAAGLDLPDHADGLVVDDGSGLSARNKVSARTLGLTLADMLARHRDTFAASLSVAGVDGTLERRFASRTRRDLRGRVHAKSGYISGVSTLSGVLRSGDRWFVFSVLVNDVPRGKTRLAKELQEQIVEILDDHN